jgi:hypothetical protein
MPKRRAILALAALALTASQAAADPVCPGEPPPAPGEGRIYLYRNEAVGFGNKPHIFIDGRDTGIRATPGDYYCLNRPAGAYKIATSMSDEDDAVVAHVEAGKSVYVRFVVSADLIFGDVEPVVLDAYQAAREVGYLQYAAHGDGK